jgi:hypothetical protein
MSDREVNIKFINEHNRYITIKAELEESNNMIKLKIASEESDSEWIITRQEATRLKEALRIILH